MKEMARNRKELKLKTNFRNGDVEKIVRESEVLGILGIQTIS